MELGLAGAEKIKLTMYLPAHLGYLASAYASGGDIDRAHSLLDQAVQRADETAEHVFTAELHRLRGELLIGSGIADEAAGEFAEAIVVARRQEAKMWELRAATSLARLLRGQGRREEARDVLAPVYGWFTEGFETTDLRGARALLDELA